MRELDGRQRYGYEERESWLGAQDRGTEGRKVERKDREAFPSEIHSRYPQLPLPPIHQVDNEGEVPEPRRHVQCTHIAVVDPGPTSGFDVHLQQMGIQG